MCFTERNSVCVCVCVRVCVCEREREKHTQLKSVAEYVCIVVFEHFIASSVYGFAALIPLSHQHPPPAPALSAYVGNGGKAALGITHTHTLLRTHRCRICMYVCLFVCVCDCSPGAWCSSSSLVGSSKASSLNVSRTVSKSLYC